ncbi:MAG: glycosyltransferase family protein [Bacteroidota bacterium]|nr:glycosyltransferase family protein [Bacteroidota bacterium]
MKILYAIQGTGNGHISRARDIITLLQKKGELDLLISGTEADVELGFPVKYTLKGLSFVFGKKGGVDLVSTYKKARLKRFYNEIKNLPVKDYDLVISDFEPVSAWACRLRHKKCIGLSHQSAVINKKSPKPKNIDPAGKLILKNYAPVAVEYGFHFMQYDKKIFMPVIRNEIRNAENMNLGHYTVYLPAYSDAKIIKVLSQVSNAEWQVFSKHTEKAYWQKNIAIFPINNQGFIKSMVTAAGVFCGAGFETPSEALFLEKKLMVIPMKGQYEQQCNAAALKKMNVPVLKKLKLSQLEKIKEWVKEGKIINVNYPDITERIVDKIFDKHISVKDKYFAEPGTVPYSLKKLRKIIVDNIQQ